jgi:arylsulfatase A-like enzyme
MIWDGMRPDFVRSDLTPTLLSLAERGVRFERHHAVYPSHTRVNSASIATGRYPSGHGIVGNSIYVPSVNPDAALNTGGHEALAAIRARTGRILAAPTMVEILGRADLRTAVVSAGSPGSAVIQGDAPRHFMVNVRGVVRPAAAERAILDRYGPFPANSIPATARNDRAVDILLGEILPGDYALMILWLSDPDTTQHVEGLGSAPALQAIRECDQRLQRILAAIERQGAGDDIDIFVGSDHGFSTILQRGDVVADLRADGFPVERIVVAGGNLYLRDAAADLETRLVRGLQDHPGVAQVFTRGGSSGTLSLRDVLIDHAESPPRVVFAAAWSDAVNEFGVAGTTVGGGSVASHGSLSPFDMHNLLVAAGPRFKSGLHSDMPSGNVDIAPTVVHLLGVDAVPPFDGRVLHEALADGGPPVDLEVTRQEVNSVTPDGTHQQSLESLGVGHTRYVSSISVG